MTDSTNISVNDIAFVGEYISEPGNRTDLQVGGYELMEGSTKKDHLPKVDIAYTLINPMTGAGTGMYVTVADSTLPYGFIGQHMINMGVPFLAANKIISEARVLRFKAGIHGCRKDRTLVSDPLDLLTIAKNISSMVMEAASGAKLQVTVECYIRESDGEQRCVANSELTKVMRSADPGVEVKIVGSVQ